MLHSTRLVVYTSGMDDGKLEEEKALTEQELAGAEADQVVGAMFGAMRALFRQFFDRLEALENVVLPRQGAEVVSMPPPAGGPDAGAAERLLDPGSELERLRSERRALEERLAALRARAAGAAVAQPAPLGQQLGAPPASPAYAPILGSAGAPALPSPTVPVVQAAAVAPTGQPLSVPAEERYEIQHAEGSLVGRADMVGVPLRHATIGAAESIANMIVANHPGWRDRLVIRDRAVP